MVVSYEWNESPPSCCESRCHNVSIESYGKTGIGQVGRPCGREVMLTISTGQETWDTAWIAGGSVQLIEGLF